MPLYDFTLGDLSGQSSFRRLGYEAPDLDGAITEAVAWAKNTRRLGGSAADLAHWPLVILAGADRAEHSRGTVLFEMKDARAGLSGGEAATVEDGARH